MTPSKPFTPTPAMLARELEKVCIPLMIWGLAKASPSDVMALMAGSTLICPTAARKLFFMTCDARSKRGGIEATSLFSEDSERSRAFITTSEVILPSAAIARICPLVTPRYSERARVIRGACSITLFNSSPRSVPEAIACDSWMLAAVASC
ncbi:hypothetical protein D3C81_719690 [compost metagenome]